jgi:hypothetical protein
MSVPKTFENITKVLVISSSASNLILRSVPVLRISPICNLLVQLNFTFHAEIYLICDLGANSTKFFRLFSGFDFECS